jgi:hypothetical protein
METLYVLTALKKKLALLCFATLFFAAGALGQTTWYFFNGGETPAGGPTGADANVADAPVEIGVKFRTSVAGNITGIRFYKGTTNTGTHVASLWTNGNPGTSLATVTFSGETASGWQEMPFASPVHINAGTIYVASYYSAGGVYAATSNYFNSGDITHGPITFIDVTNDPQGQGNGVFEYGGATVYPDNSFQASNYWVDVRFLPDVPLPVSLVDFNATAGNSDVALSWKTESEDNNKGFSIQRSNNNRDWYDISFVNGAGQSSSTRSYSYSDKGLAPGVYYYRLNQIDFDGKSKASSTVSATISGKGAIALFQNAPNPFIGTTKIRFDLSAAQKVRLSVFDLTGREIRVLVDAKKETGTHLVTLNSAGLSRQMYIVRLQTESGVFTKQIIVE